MAAIDGTGRERALQQQARALGDANRYAIFRYLAGAAAPVRISELCEHFGLNHNAIRQHLAKLSAAGLLVEEIGAPAGPGRPALRYRVDPAAASNWTTPSPYQELAVLLAATAGGTDSAREVGAEVGRRIAAEAGDNGLAVIEAEMRRRGFEPQTVEEIDGSLAVVLGRCAFAEAASAAPHVVCELHLGLAEGIVGELDGYEVRGLVANDPGVAGCRLELRRETPAAPS